MDPTPEEIARDNRIIVERKKLERDKQKRIKHDLDRATRLLCEIMRTYDLEDPSKELLEWWEKHKKADAARRRRETLEQKKKEKLEKEYKEHVRALEKLNSKEKKLIEKHGLKGKAFK